MRTASRGRMRTGRWTSQTAGCSPYSTHEDQSTYSKASGGPAFGKQLGRTGDLFNHERLSTSFHLGVYENAFRDRTSTQSVFDFRKQASRKDMAKHESVSSIDYIPTKCLVKDKLAPKITTSVVFNKQKERDEILYKHKNQMVENIALENTKEEREKIVRERK